MAPDQVTEANEEVVRLRLYPPQKKSAANWRYDVGDTVHITGKKTTFAKGYKLGKWSREVFKIASRLSTVPPTYALEDKLGEAIKGKFYEAELQKVTERRGEQFVVNKILKTGRGRDGKVRYFVSWLGYPSKFDSWVDELATID